jgi:hypothetical protein
VLEGEPLPAGSVLLPGEIVTQDNLESVVTRQNDPDIQREWYADFMEENLEEIYANVKPFED